MASALLFNFSLSVILFTQCESLLLPGFFHGCCPSPNIQGVILKHPPIISLHIHISASKSISGRMNLRE